MATSPMLIALDGFYDRYVSGAPSGSYINGLNVAKLAITTPDPDKIEVLGAERSNLGQALGSYQFPKPDEIEIAFDNFDPEVLSMILMGDPAAYTQASGTAQTLTFTSVHDRWVDLGKHDLSSFAITGKTLGTDYEVNLEAGMVRVLSTGSIDDATSTDATASWAARSGHTIIARTEQSLNLKIKGSGVNLYTGERGLLLIHNASVAPSQAINWGDGKAPVSAVLKGTLVTPSGQTGPYSWTAHSAG